MERLFRFFGFRRSTASTKKEVPAVPAKPPVPKPEPRPDPVSAPVPKPAPVQTPTPAPATSSTVPPSPTKDSACRGKEGKESRQEVKKQTTAESKENRKSATEQKTQDTTVSKQEKKPLSKELVRKRGSRDQPNKLSRTSTGEKANTRKERPPERPTQDPLNTQRSCKTEMSENNEKTTEVDPGKTLASECEKKTKSVISECEKKTTVRKEKISMRSRMKDAAMASSRQLRRASNSLNDSARKLRGLVSRPIKERLMNKFMERVNQRKERRLKANSESMQLRESEDAFPTMQGVSADNLIKDGPPSEKTDKSEIETKSEKSDRRIGTSNNNNKDIDKIFPNLSKDKKEKGKTKGSKGSDIKSSKKSFLSGKRRKHKDGDIFVNGKPFWMRAGKLTQEERNEITQDDLPMNAEVIVDVKNGKIELPVLPNIPIKFDAYADMEILRARDNIFFTHKMLFANTIRSMINTSEVVDTDTDTGNTDIEKTVEQKTEYRDVSLISKKVTILPHPKISKTYKRAIPMGKVGKETFEWTGKGVV